MTSRLDPHDAAIISGLDRYGISLTRSDPDLPVVDLVDSGST
jgi:hypothetical protein